MQTIKLVSGRNLVQAYADGSADETVQPIRYMHLSWQDTAEHKSTQASPPQISPVN